MRIDSIIKITDSLHVRQNYITICILTMREFEPSEIKQIIERMIINENNKRSNRGIFRWSI